MCVYKLGKCCRRHKLPISHRIGPDPASIDAAMIGERTFEEWQFININASGVSIRPCCSVAAAAVMGLWCEWDGLAVRLYSMQCT
jgi:hypothetical protein